MIANASVCRATTLEDLDQIVSQAKNLDEFLNHPEWVDEYFLGLQNYYGANRFPRQSFDAILKQLKTISALVPEIKDRLWEMNGLGEPFTIDAAIRSQGRNLNRENWTKYFRNWQYQNRPKDLTINQIQSIFSAINSEIESSNKQTSVLPRKQREIAQGTLMKKLRAQENTSLVARDILYKYIWTHDFQNICESGDPDLILDRFNEIRQNPLEIFTSLHMPNPPGPVLSEVKSLFPSLEDLLKREDLFPIRTVKTRTGKEIPEGKLGGSYEFKPILRRFHGIWKGIPIQECVGGACQSLDSLSVERWATIAIQNSHLYNLERNGSYVGYVHEVPVQLNGQTYGSVDFGAPLLRNQVVRINPLTQTKYSEPFFKAWFDWASRHIPDGWKGYINSDGFAINNAGVKPKVHSSPEYITGETVGTPQEITFSDPIVGKILRVSRPSGKYGPNYAGNMILDATDKKAKKLKLLNQVDPNTLWTEEFAIQMLGKPDLRKDYLTYLRDTPHPQSENLKDPLIHFILSDTGNSMDSWIALQALFKRVPGAAETFLFGAKLSQSLRAQVLDELSKEGKIFEPQFRKMLLPFLKQPNQVTGHVLQIMSTFPSLLPEEEELVRSLFVSKIDRLNIWALSVFKTAKTSNPETIRAIAAAHYPSHYESAAAEALANQTITDPKVFESLLHPSRNRIQSSVLVKIFNNAPGMAKRFENQLIQLSIPSPESVRDEYPSRSMWPDAPWTLTYLIHSPCQSRQCKDAVLSNASAKNPNRQSAAVYAIQEHGWGDPESVKIVRNFLETGASNEFHRLAVAGNVIKMKPFNRDLGILASDILKKALSTSKDEYDREVYGKWLAGVEAFLSPPKGNTHSSADCEKESLRNEISQ